MKMSTGMVEIAIFLGLLGLCLTVAFTSLRYTERDVITMQENTVDVRQIQQVNTSGIAYDYMSRPGAYLDAVRLSFSVGTASADSRAKIRVFGQEIQPYDMYTMNIGATAQSTPTVYKSLEEWWKGFSASEQYKCIYGVSCFGPHSCPNAQEHSYVFSGNRSERTFAPTHITSDLAGYEMENPMNLSEAKFKLRVVEVGKDAVSNEPILEYRIYIFLGSLVKQQPTSTPQVEYRWYECVLGDAANPWVVLE